MKKLNPTKLIAIEIPDSAEQIKIIKYKGHAVLNYKIGDCQNWSENNGIDGVNKILKNCEILGEVTKDKVQFDVEPYVEKVWSKNKTFYYDYIVTMNEETIKTDNWYKHTPQESFQSLLKTNDVKIPKGKKLLILLNNN